MNPATLLQTILQDLRYGARSFKRSPMLAAAVILTFGLGIGLSTTVFAVINGFFFRARVDKDPGSFVQLVAQHSGNFERPRGMLFSSSLEDFRAYRDRAQSLTTLAGWSNVSATIGDDPRPVMPLLVTCDFFSLYGLTHPKLGRLFHGDECSAPGQAPVVVISEEMWRRRFSTDPNIIGAEITLNRHPFTIVGVTPARFSGQLKAGIWIPWTMQAVFYRRDLFRQVDVPWLVVEGRIRPGYSKPAAEAEVRLIASQQDRLHPGRKTDLRLTNGSMSQYPGIRSQLYWIVLLWMGAVTAVLLMASVNVTTLLLSRAAARKQEIAIRLSLGAGRFRLLRMLLTECLMLAVVAGILSAFLAYRVPDIFAAMLPDVHYPVSPDFTVFAYLSAATVLAALVAGSAPAVESLKLDLASSMKGLFSSSDTKQSRMLQLLVTAQIAMSAMLLVVTGLVLHARSSIAAGDPGFETAQVLLVPINLPQLRYTPEATFSLYRSLEQRARSLPGVQSISFASAPQFSGDDEGPNDREEVRLPGQSHGTGQRASANIVSVGYFETLGIPIQRGRSFNQADIGAPQTIVSEAFARIFWPSADPIGQVIECSNGATLRVVGVARDTRSESFGGTDGPKFYVLQAAGSFEGSLLARFQGDSASIRKALRNVTRELDREAIGEPRTLQSIIDEMAARFGIAARMVLMLGTLTVFLAVIGIYGVLAFVVARRTRELGIRMALGATQAEILRFVLASGMRPVFAGLAFGALLALAGSQVLARVLRGAFTIGAFDPLTYPTVLALLLCVALAAMLAPALRASTADPMRALRHEDHA